MIFSGKTDQVLRTGGRLHRPYGGTKHPWRVSRRALLHTLSGNKEDPLAEEEEIRVSDRASIDGIRRKYAAE